MLRNKTWLIAVVFLSLSLNATAKSCNKNSDCDNWEKDHCACHVGSSCSGFDWKHLTRQCQCDGSSGNQHNCPKS